MKKIIFLLSIVVTFCFSSKAQVTVTDLTPTACTQRTLQVAYYGGAGAIGGSGSYRAQKIQIDYYNNTNCNAISGGSGYAWQTYNIPNWQTAGNALTYWTFTAPANGFYTATVFYFFIPNSGGNGMSSSPIGSFCLSNLVKAPVANGSINTGSQNVCLSSAMTLNNTSTNNPTSYRVSGYAINANCGTAIAGGWSSGSTNPFTSGNPATIDLKTVPSLGNYFQNISHTGWYKIKLEVQNSCGTSSKEFCINVLNPAIPSGSFQFSICDGSGVAAPAISLPGTPTSSLGSGSIINTATLGSVDSFSYLMERYYQFLQTNPYWGVIDTPKYIYGTPPVSKSFNAIMNSWGIGHPFAGGYFNGIVLNPQFRVTLSVKNVCGVATKTGYFTPTDANCKTDGSETSTGIEENNSSNSTLRVMPNPTTDVVNFKWTQTTNSNTTLFLTSLDGRLVKTMLNNEAISEGEVNRSFSIADLPAGVYIYQLKGESNHFGKIVKQ